MRDSQRSIDFAVARIHKCDGAEHGVHKGTGEAQAVV